MRHSTIDLTMNVYTDPKLLDVYGTLDSLPSLNLDTSPSTERQTMRATGTDNRDAVTDSRHPVTKFAPAFAPNSGQRRESVSFAVISSDVAMNERREVRHSKTAGNPTKKPCQQCLRARLFEWRRPGSNRQPQACKASALPVELRPPWQAVAGASVCKSQCNGKPFTSSASGEPLRKPTGGEPPQNQ